MSKTYLSASLRRMVGDRANGCCEYCLIPESLSLSSHQVDHWSFDKKIFYAIYSVYQGNSSTTDSVFSQIVKTPIDHVIAEKHGGDTTPDNLALSCSLCNQAKGSDIASIDPNTGETVRLYNPRKDSWRDHFTLEVESGLIQPQTAIGRVTVKILRMNRLESLPIRQILIKTGYIALI